MPRYLANTNALELALPCVVGDEESVYFIAVLDGSDQYAEHHGSARAQAKEDVHRDVAGACVEAGGGDWLREYEGSYPDAVFARFSGEDRAGLAVSVALSLHRELNVWNLEHQLGWVEQVHSRVALAPMRPETAALLLQRATRGEVLVHNELWNLLATSQLPLDNLRLDIGRASDEEAWTSIEQQLESGILLAGDESHVGRKRARHIARFEEFRQATARFRRRAVC